MTKILIFLWELVKVCKADRTMKQMHLMTLHRVRAWGSTYNIPQSTHFRSRPWLICFSWCGRKVMTHSLTGVCYVWHDYILYIERNNKIDVYLVCNGSPFWLCWFSFFTYIHGSRPIIHVIVTHLQWYLHAIHKNNGHHFQVLLDTQCILLYFVPIPTKSHIPSLAPSRGWQCIPWPEGWGRRGWRRSATLAGLSWWSSGGSRRWSWALGSASTESDPGTTPHTSGPPHLEPNSHGTESKGDEIIMGTFPWILTSQNPFSFLTFKKCGVKYRKRKLSSSLILPWYFTHTVHVAYHMGKWESTFCAVFVDQADFAIPTAGVQLKDTAPGIKMGLRRPTLWLWGKQNVWIACVCPTMLTR